MPTTATAGERKPHYKLPLFLQVLACVLGSLYLLTLLGTLPVWSVMMDDADCHPDEEVCMSLADYYAEHWYLIFEGVMNLMIGIMVLGGLILTGALVYWIYVTFYSCTSGECQRQCKCDCGECSTECLRCCIYCCSAYEPLN